MDTKMATVTSNQRTLKEKSEINFPVIKTNGVKV